MADPLDACFLPINQTTVELLTSNAGWNKLATDFVNGLSSGLTNDMITRIGNLIFGKSSENALDLSWELVSAQPWLIVFIVIGAVFSVLSLVGALATCIWACTCRRSSKGVQSSCMNITGIILAFISFGFVVAGIVLYALSVSSFVNGTLNAPYQLDIVLNNGNGFAMGVTNQIGCSIDKGFGGISADIENLPAQMITAFEQDTFISSLLDHDYDALAENLMDSEPQVQTIFEQLTAANAVIPAADTVAKKQVTDALATYSLLLTQGVSEGPNKLPTIIKAIGVDMNNTKNTIEDTVNTDAKPIVDQTTAEINKTIDEVQSTITAATDTIKTVLDEVQKLLNKITDFEKDLNKNGDLNNWVTAAFDSLIIIPCAIALLAALIAFVVGMFFAFQKTSIPSKGCCSASCTLITFSIIVLTIAFIVMVPATLAMTFGYGANLMCQPFFYDDDLKALTAIDDIFTIPSIPSMKGGNVQLKFSDIMISCQKKASFMNAVHGDQIIDLSVIEQAFNPTELANQLNTTISTADIPELNKNQLDTLNALLTQIVLSPDLTNAIAADPALADTKKKMDALAGTLNQTITECTDIGNQAEDFTDKEVIITMLQVTSSDFIFKVYGDLTNSAQMFTSDLMKKSAPCTPVYQSYEDLGLVACEQMGGGVQGMWAAAGLAALFFLPTVIAVFCVASALRGGKAKNQKVNPSPDVFH